MYNAIFHMSSHVEKYILIGIHSKFPDNKESHVLQLLQRKYIRSSVESK